MNEHKDIKIFEEAPDLLTPIELQALLGVGRTKVYHLLESGEIRHLRIGRTYKIPKCYVVDFIESSCYNRDVATDPPSGGIEI
jgi:excisionase family DNA binding protein